MLSCAGNVIHNGRLGLGVSRSEDVLALDVLTIVRASQETFDSLREDVCYV